MISIYALIIPCAVAVACFILALKASSEANEESVRADEFKQWLFECERNSAQTIAEKDLLIRMLYKDNDALSDELALTKDELRKVDTCLRQKWKNWEDRKR